jgi:hypothetical protein
MAKETFEGEAHIRIDETPEGLTVSIPNHMKYTGVETKGGNTTIGTTHGNIMLNESGFNFSLNLWKRGRGKNPRRNVTLS